MFGGAHEAIGLAAAGNGLGVGDLLASADTFIHSTTRPPASSWLHPLMAATGRETVAVGTRKVTARSCIWASSGVAAPTRPPVVSALCGSADKRRDSAERSQNEEMC